MLALPHIGAVPRTYTTAQVNPLAAKMALALAGDAEIRAPRSPRQSLELDVLRDQLGAWLARQQQGIGYCAPKIHIGLGRREDDMIYAPPAANAYMLWLGNAADDYIGSVWQLEGRWRAIEAKVRGLAGAALNAIDNAGAHSFPLYTPSTARWWASYVWWHGDDDEKYVIEEWKANEGEEAGEPDVPTRAWLDKVLPPVVTLPRPNFKRRDLERHARGRGEPAEIARLILAIDAAIKAERRRKNGFELESQHEMGFQATGFAASVRWNGRDPMFRIFDDYGQISQQEEGCNESYGWLAVEGAGKLPGILVSLERRFAIARLVDELLAMIATKVRT
jgi:PRTRC genetic system protein F